MSSKINVSIDNPYRDVTIPRAKLRPSDDNSTVIANPGALSDDGNPYGSSGSAPPPPYTVKEDKVGDEEGGRCQACCYRCRKK